MDEHPNATVLRNLLDAFNEGRMEAGSAMIADDVEWHEIGRAEPIHGKAALVERYSSGEGADWDITAEVHDVIGNDDHAIGLVNATARHKDGQELHYRTAEVVHVRDGKVVERWALSDDTEAINRFFAS